MPAVLLGIQLAAYIFFGNSPEVFTKAAGSGDTAKPQVLGASIDLRGEKPVASLRPLAPAIDDADMKKISAKSFVVYDLQTGTVLASRQPDLKLSIASLTKLMTGFLAYQNLDFGQQISVSRAGLTSVSPVVNFIDGDSVSAGDVFDAMMVGSCNDAAQVLGRAVAGKTGTSIADLMNMKARELGMSNTSYSNPVGFDSTGNYSTAGDLMKLVNTTQQLAAFTNLGKTKEIQFSGASGRQYHTVATNKLIGRYLDLQAVKTGYTEGAQGAMISKIVKNGHEMIIIVLGSQDREADTVTLKDLVAEKTVWE